MQSITNFNTSQQAGAGSPIFQNELDLSGRTTFSYIAQDILRTVQQPGKEAVVVEDLSFDLTQEGQAPDITEDELNNPSTTSITEVFESFEQTVTYADGRVEVLKAETEGLFEATGNEDVPANIDYDSSIIQPDKKNTVNNDKQVSDKGRNERIDIPRVVEPLPPKPEVIKLDSKPVGDDKIKSGNVQVPTNQNDDIKNDKQASDKGGNERIDIPRIVEPLPPEPEIIKLGEKPASDYKPIETNKVFSFSSASTSTSTTTSSSTFTLGANSSVLEQQISKVILGADSSFNNASSNSQSNIFFGGLSKYQ